MSNEQSLNKLLTKYCTGFENTRIKSDLKKHNWLIQKLRKFAERRAMAEREAPKKSFENKKIGAKVAKRKESLPVSLPIGLYCKFMEHKKSHSRKTTVIVNNLGVNNVSEIKRVESNTLRWKEDIEPKAKEDRQSLMEKSTQTPASREQVQDNLHIMGHYRYTNEQSTQTETITENEREILNVIGNYGYTIDDIHMFHQNSINDNNNQSSTGNLNVLTDQEINQTNVVSQNHNEINKISNTADERKSTNCGITLNKVDLFSDLNKLILSRLYVASTKKDDGHKELSKTSQSLVNEIFEMVSLFFESRKLNTYNEIVEILDDIEDEEQTNETPNTMIEQPQNMTDAGNINCGPSQSQNASQETTLPIQMANTYIGIQSQNLLSQNQEKNIAINPTAVNEALDLRGERMRKQYNAQKRNYLKENENIPQQVANDQYARFLCPQQEMHVNRCNQAPPARPTRPVGNVATHPQTSSNPQNIQLVRPRLSPINPNAISSQHVVSSIHSNANKAGATNVLLHSHGGGFAGIDKSQNCRIPQNNSEYSQNLQNPIHLSTNNACAVQQNYQNPNQHHQQTINPIRQNDTYPGALYGNYHMPINNYEPTQNQQRHNDMMRPIHPNTANGAEMYENFWISQNNSESAHNKQVRPALSRINPSAEYIAGVPQEYQNSQNTYGNPHNQQLIRQIHPNAFYPQTVSYPNIYPKR
ncbi:putative uncharacterized protein DDB_G0286901 [Plodia interpunctella]|uniref:putative uncharacterized protein DDB_G0286901 n=1 Tax=Plodia interpunctella TaxID=58824 RepID=UPI002368926A|nr:putative uncharacterized protein DDB_G0286901 [Plodia interpunctella]